MASWIGVIVETGGRTDWPDVGVQVDGPPAPHVWVEVTASVFTIMDDEGLEGFARQLSSHFSGEAILLLAQTTSSTQYAVAYHAGEQVRSLRALGFAREEVGAHQPWEMHYLSRDGTADGERLPDVDGIRRLLEAYDLDPTDPGARWVPPSHRRGMRWVGAAGLLLILVPIAGYLLGST